MDTTSKRSATRLRKDQFAAIGESTARFFHYLNSDVFLKFLEELTGVQNLRDDPAVTGAGVSSIDHGGFLNIHADFSQEPEKAPGWRRLNLLLHLN